MDRRLRLLSGMVMLAYVATHLLNHAVGLVSLDAMEAMLRLVVAVWSNPLGTALLYGSFAVHYVLALYALWQRRSLRPSFGEASQLILGFAIPILLARHVVLTRVASGFFEADTRRYAYVLWNFFVRRPDSGWWQMATLVVAWTHAMIGLNYWLRVRPWYGRLRAPALVVAVQIPVLALLGMVAAGRQVAALAADPAWTSAMLAGLTLPTQEAAAALDRLATALAWLFAAAVAAMLAGRLVRREWQRRKGLVRIAYPDGRAVEVVPGTSVLEASRLARVPHAAVCGGRGRCSTCRVRVRAAPRAIPPPGDAETRVLRRIGASANIRLACQLRPRGPVAVAPLLPPFATASDSHRPADLAHGSERELAILFIDMRGFTTMADGRLPYDVVFVLNRYFAAMGRAVEAAGGRVDKFIGDGVMALFGMESDVETGCRQAFAAARLMSASLGGLNGSLREELEAPLRIGIGIHSGPVIVGEMGYGSATTMTAIGDAVNTANRLEALTKEFDCELVVSEEAAGRAGLDLSRFPRRSISVRGKREMLTVRIVDDCSLLADPQVPRAAPAGLQGRPGAKS